jgi:hypothetical protein
MCKVNTFSLYFEIPTTPTNDHHLIFKLVVQMQRDFDFGLGLIYFVHLKLSNVGISKLVEK